jgi:DNA-directed RNA polymerase specialized sigma24 family protein
VNGSTRRKKVNVLTQEAFDGLLAGLDPDPARAALAYETIRQKLIRFFEWRQCRWPDEYADETLNRVARKLIQGQDVPDVSKFAKGVAKLVCKEKLREESRTEALEEDPGGTDASSEADPEQSILVDCFEACLRELPEENRDTIVRYYDDTKRKKIDGRERLAQERGITVAALRLRTHRIREGLKECVQECVERKAVTKMDLST